MMAIHHTLQILIVTYHNKPAPYIHRLPQCPTPTKHSNQTLTTHNNHPDKHILESMVQMLLLCATLNVII